MRVLLVDDDKETLKAMSCFLDQDDIEVLALADSEEAARSILHKHFEAIILDVVMPSPDGFELTRLARQTSANRRTPIGLITGYDDAETRRLGAEAGATYFAGKPATREKIRGLLKALLEAGSSDQKNRAR